ncbi:hypothetical protein COCON_G00235090, partial [Conger conger]
MMMSVFLLLVMLGLFVQESMADIVTWRTNALSLRSLQDGAHRLPQSAPAGGHHQGVPSPRTRPSREASDTGM